MRSRLSTIAVVALTALLLQGCDLSPTAPSRTPTAPPAVNSDTSNFSSNSSVAPGSDNYTYTGSGDLTFFPDPADARRGNGKRSSRVLLCGFVGCTDMIKFSSDFLDEFTNGANCFGGAGTKIPFAGSIDPANKKNPGGVHGTLFFKGNGTAGTKEFKYAFFVTGTVISGTFPPTFGNFATVRWDNGELNTEGKGKGSKGRNAGSACTCDVTFTAGSTITVEGKS